MLPDHRADGYRDDRERPGIGASLLERRSIRVDSRRDPLDSDVDRDGTPGSRVSGAYLYER